MTGRALAACVVAFGALGVVTPDARADDLKAALDELKAGAGYFEKGEYLTAIAHYEKAHDFAPDAPGPHRELGKAYDKAGRAPEAVAAFARYLELKPKARDAAKVSKRLAALKKELAEAWGRASVRSDPSGAAVFVDAAPSAVGSTPIEGLWLRPGDHELRLELKGYVAGTHGLAVAAGSEAAANVTLERIPDPEPPAAPVLVPVATTAPEPPSSKHGEKKGRSSGVWIGVGITAGVAVVGAGVVLTIVLLRDGTPDVPGAELPPLRP